MKNSNPEKKQFRQNFFLFTTLNILLSLLVSVPAWSQFNVAQGKTVTTSGTTAGGPASNIVDGSFSTNAITTGSQTPPNAEWYEIDLGADYFIDSVTIGSADARSSRRFLLVTWPSSVGSSLGASPVSYTSLTTASVYNRLIYTDTARVTGGNPYGTYAGNPNVPGTAGLSFGPAFPSTVLGLNVGLHKARYVRILSLQDTAFALSELQVFTSALPKIRTFSNGSFESGSTTMGTSNVREKDVPGWSTTEAVTMFSTTAALAPAKGSYIEFWRSGGGPGGVLAASGNYFVELNAFTAGMLEQQPICVQGGETFNWSFAHRGRSGVDTMALHIDDTDVAVFRDNNASSGIHSSAVLSAGTTTISGGLTNTANGWTQWSGTWTNPSSSARSITFGFRALGSSGGNISLGNFIDSVSVVTNAAFASLSTNTASGAEDIPTANLPKIIINGTLNAPHTIELDITGGTATRGTDYVTTPATGVITVTIPAGNYDGTGAQGISLAPYISIETDTVLEPDETIVIRLQNPSPATLQIVSDTSCMPAITDVTYTIINAVPLPVNLVSFDADFINKCDLNFTWMSGVESELSYYQLEYSPDGQTFSAAAEKKTGLGSNQRYEQVVPVRNNGINIYRLKMFSHSGAAAYSEILRVNSNCDAENHVLLYPNPNKGLLHIKGLQGQADVSITDVLGREMLRARLTEGQDQLDMTRLAPGNYILTIQTGKALFNYRITREQ